MRRLGRKEIGKEVLALKEVRYMISDAANKLGMEAHVLRYWEEELELEVPRNEMGHRYYTEEWLDTFRQILMLKEQGYQLRAIKMVLHNKNQHNPEQLIVDLEKNISLSTAVNGAVAPATSGKIEQFQMMMTTIVKNALAENNQELGQVVSEHVGEKVLKEMNYLMREREEQEEARFRKLDETLRTRQKGLKSRRERRLEKKPQGKSLKSQPEEGKKKSIKQFLSSWEEA